MAIKNITGVMLPIVSDTDSRAATPFTRNLIILGNRSTSKISSELYDRNYSHMDLKYPGSWGYSVRSLHNHMAMVTVVYWLGAETRRAFFKELLARRSGE